MMAEDGTGDLALAFPQSRSEERSEVGQNGTGRRTADGQRWSGRAGVEWGGFGTAERLRRRQGRQPAVPSAPQPMLTSPRDVRACPPKHVGACVGLSSIWRKGGAAPSRNLPH